MLGSHVYYVDGDSKEHLAIVTTLNGDNTINVFVYDYSKVIENVNNEATVFCYKEITVVTQPELPLNT